MSADIATGVYLARLRDEAGLKQKELARKVTWSPAVLSRVESGERTVTSDELDSILAAIGTEKALIFRQTVGRLWKYLEKPPLGHPDESLLWKAELALQEIDNLLGKPDIRSSATSLLGKLNGELLSAARLVHGTEHSIALVGDIGVGKSTAICRVAGLDVQDGKTGALVPVLEVGGGGVTICEVHLVQGPEYGLIIEPMGEQEIQDEVRELASLIKEPPAPPDDDGTGDAAFGTSKELDRAIRNMSGLTRKRTTQKGPDGRTVRAIDDPVKRLAEESTDTVTLVIEILARMNLESRTRRELWYPRESSNKSPLEWLKENYELLNNGRRLDFSIPKRVEIVVPRPILDKESPSIRLIDTKGIDRTAERADLENLFSEANTVLVMCSTFNAAPSPSVQQLLTRARDGSFADIEGKGVVLALPRDHEALAVKDDDGVSAESTEDGYELKRDQAQATIRSMGFRDLRIEFFNAMSDDPNHFRDLLLDLVQGLRERHQSKLQAVISDARSLVDNFEQEQALAVQRAAATQLQTWIDNNRTLDFSSLYEPERSLIQAMNDAHPSSVRASVRRQGEWDNLDYSYQLGYGARRAATRATRTKLNSFHAVVDNLLENAEFEDASGLLRHARRLVDAGAEGLLKRCRLLGERIHARHMKRSGDLWRKSDHEWGRGPGYRDRVGTHHRDWFNDDKCDYRERIQLLIRKEWEGVLNSLSDILEIA